MIIYLIDKWNKNILSNNEILSNDATIDIVWPQICMVFAKCPKAIPHFVVIRDRAVVPTFASANKKITKWGYIAEW